MDYCYSDDDDDQMDNCYSDDDRMEYTVSDEEAGEESLPDSDDSRRHKNYKILKPEDIKKTQENDISDVINVLSVSRSVACTLLCQHRWNPTSVYDSWFERPIDVVNSQKQVSPSLCKICYETLVSLSAPCGHPFCADCWQTYIRFSIEGGPGCLTLKCPEPGCESHPGLDMVDSVSSPVDKRKYYQFLHRSYVESSPKRKWCPGPGCDLAIQFDGGKDEGNDITCTCGYKVCWSCGDECHSPLDCATVAKWLEKNNSEAENTTWIMAYTKPCPKCRRAIEKNQGCHHMTCGAPCNYHFCWTCLEDWKKHGYDKTCNGYRGIEVEKQAKRKNAKQYMRRYTHYFERWDSNHKSRKMALASLGAARDEQVARLAERQKQSHSQLGFVLDAWEQVVECRRVLKWSYAYGFYNISTSAKVKKELFEHLQGEAESSLERLHGCAEKEMDKYLKADEPCDDFNEFRQKVAGLTSVTKNYFKNLVCALENDLSEVDEIVVDDVVDVKVDETDETRRDSEEEDIFSDNEEVYGDGDMEEDENIDDEVV